MLKKTVLAVLFAFLVSALSSTDARVTTKHEIKVTVESAYHQEPLGRKERRLKKPKGPKKTKGPKMTKGPKKTKGPKSTKEPKKTKGPKKTKKPKRILTSLFSRFSE
mmetsp:Transcript_20596/g.30924  ORF Transcript_20596/g.30924 Transcript_20596/m.30924 type:complete len:107 (-) Transcript_20596:58-378(-)